MKRRRFAQLVVAATIVGLPGTVLANGALQLTLEADRSRARVGEPFQLELVASGEERVPTPRLPDGIDADFEIMSESAGSSTQATLIGGRFERSTRRTLTAVLAARKAGKFSLSFTAKDGGKTIRSNTVVIEVQEADQQEIADPESGKPISASGDVFVWASVDKVRAYVGEQINYSLDVYERRRFRMGLRTPPSFEDFLTEKLPNGEDRVEVVQDVRYYVQPGMRRALFPQRSGTLIIGAAELSLGLRAPTRSQALEIEVLPLPAEGQPEGFSPNNVGLYKISTEVDRTDLQPGEPFTLTVTIEGDGNVAVIDPGQWPTIDGVRRYDPKVETQKRIGDVVGGTRSYSFLLIAERPGKITIPSHQLAMFDPADESYKTAKTEPIDVTVAGEPIVGESDEPVPEDRGGGELAAVIAADGVPRRTPRERWLTPGRWMYGMLAVPTLTALGLGGGFLYRKFGPDEAARARGMAKLRRKLRIDAAEAACETGEGFHAAVSRLLQELAVASAGPDGVGLPRPELLKLLEHRGIAEKDLAQLEGLLERCDAARFAAGEGDEAERRAMLDEALGLVRSSSLAKAARS